MKLQFWSFDVVFSMVVFSGALMLLTLVWYNQSNQFSSTYGLEVLSIQAQLLSLQNRIMMQGSPYNWYSVLNAADKATWSNISIGIGTGIGNNISTSRLDALMSIASFNYTSYQNSKQMLGIGYDYLLNITGTNIHILIGRNPAAFNATSVQTASMPIFIEGNPANMKIELWTNTTLGVS